MSRLKSELAARNLKIIANYNDAVITIRKQYFDKAKSQTINSGEQSKFIDQLLVLDFIIESNQRVLNYLNHFKKHQRALSIQALEDILSNLTTQDHENIHATILRFRNNITLQGQNVSEKLKNDYNFLGNIYGSLAIGFLILGVSLGPIMSICGVQAIELALIAAGLSLPAVLIPVVFAVVLSMLAFQYQTHLYAQPDSFFYESRRSPEHQCGRMIDCLEVCFPVDDPDDDTLFEKSYENDFTTYTERRENHSLIATTTTLFSPQRQQRIAALREKFERELAQEVEVEYTSPNQLDR